VSYNSSFFTIFSHRSLSCSQEDLLIHGDSVYDIIDKQDHATIQAELNRNVPPQPGGSNSSSNVGVGVGDSTASNGNGGVSSLEGEHRMFLCRMNVSRNARRQMRFGDQKVSICVCVCVCVCVLVKVYE